MKKIINFTGTSKIFFGISIAIIVIGIVFNCIFGVSLDIQFTGGTILQYNYTGDIDTDAMKSLIQSETADTVSFNISENITVDESGTQLQNGYLLAVQFSGKETITPDIMNNVTAKLQETFPDNDFKIVDSQSVESSMGWKFFLKCMVAVALACVLMVIFVAFRFKKIGGWSAGVMALVALFHDVIMIYFTFVIFRMPIDSNFIAVTLMILGYSLNDTIVIYDRVRENRNRLAGKNIDYNELFNKSATQVFRRTLCTSITTLAAIVSVFIFAMVFNIQSVVTFALPMMVGVISGCYSSICIAGPLWVIWQNHKLAKAPAKKAKTK
ncbi:MAG: protein translocase subunit SecF [Acutalibacteraceae bacterium]|nr:protein translocase subunit SecF [Acutalibacteraceae bacterium]